MNPVFERHYADLRRLAPDVQRRNLGSGIVIEIPGFSLMPVGAWSRPSTTVRFVAPLGYPQAQPDCFWVDADVRLASGAMPMNAALNITLGPKLLWFSWHVLRWNPNTDSLSTFYHVIADRLRKAQ